MNVAHVNELAAIPERVAEGVQWMNRIQPGWEDQINPGQLYIGDCANCIIGQVFGDYNEHAPLLLSDCQVLDLGFYKSTSATCNEGELAEYYDVLTDEWKEAIDRLFDHKNDPVMV